jgi:MAP3K TRAFs-binding domain
MADEAQGVRPVCYMVMPFRKKKVEEPRPAGAPAEIDFDALWERAYWPAIEELGYLPMRADFDPSSAIVKAMLERIAFADLVLADVTLGNGNVYYEVGIRHVAKETSCVLIAPDWCRPLFDISQFASIRFPLTNGDIPPDEAEAIRACLLAKVPVIKDSRTPYYELTQSDQADSARRSAFRDFAEGLNDFQARVKAIRLESDPTKRQQRLADLRSKLAKSALEIPEVALDLISVIRDEIGWPEVRAFIDALPPLTGKLPFVREQYLLAVSESGDPLSAIAQLDKLIEEHGDTPERRGLIGGRYKRLWRDARKARQERKEGSPSLEESRHLENAIDSYSRGMELDYNQYYCSSNLPPLLRARDDEGDAERATIVDHFVVAACDRARTQGATDPWLRPTLLGAAFRAGDTKRAAELAKSVKLEGPVHWQLDSTLKDLAEAIRQTADAEKQGRLQRVYDDLARLLVPAPG